MTATLVRTQDAVDAFQARTGRIPTPAQVEALRQQAAVGVLDGKHVADPSPAALMQLCCSKCQRRLEAVQILIAEAAETGHVPTLRRVAEVAGVTVEWAGIMRRRIFGLPDRVLTGGSRFRIPFPITREWLEAHS